MEVSARLNTLLQNRWWSHLPDSESCPANQNPIQPALNALHSNIIKHNDSYLKNKEEIIELNSILRDINQIKRCFHLDDDNANQLVGLQVALPKTKFEKMLSVALRIPQAILATLFDLLLVPVAGVLTLLGVLGLKSDPKDEDIKKNAPPILLIHGMAFNETQWLLGRSLLNKKEYGSVFSLNLDGWLSNKPENGIDDYAKMVKEKCEEICKKTGQKEVILIGHSMGGLVAGYTAENLTENASFKIRNIISIGTPWHGAPIIKALPKSVQQEKRLKQMTPKDMELKNLRKKATESANRGDRSYYTIGSENDFIVPGARSTFKIDPRRKKSIPHIGHLGLVASITAWNKIRSWLDPMYKKEPEQKS